MLNSIREKAERVIRKMRVRRCEVPFVILFSERSGSSHLCSILSNHPQIACRHEDFNEVAVDERRPLPADAELEKLGQIKCFRCLSDFQHNRINSPPSRRVVQHFHNIYACSAKACGFKFKLHIQWRLFPEVVKELQLLKPDLRIIALQRKNVLKQAISRQNMLRIQAVTDDQSCNLPRHHSRELGLQPTFSLDVDTVIKQARYLARQQAEFDSSVKRIEEGNRVQALRLEYEQLLNEEQAVVKRAFEYLEVDPDARIVSALQKATPDDLSAAITNLDELALAVRGTELEELI